MSTYCDSCGAEGAHPYTIGFGSVVTGAASLEPAVFANQDLCPSCASRAAKAVEQLGTQLANDRDRRRAVAASAEAGKVAKIGVTL